MTEAGVSPFSSLRFHHVGLLTRQSEEAAKTLAALGYRVGEAVFDPLQNVELRMAHNADPASPAIEVIVPGKGNAGLERLVQKRTDYMYHVCYEVDNAADFVKRLEEAGVAIHELSPPKPAVLFDRNPVSFYLVGGLGVVELLETAR